MAVKKIEFIESYIRHDTEGAYHGNEYDGSKRFGVRFKVKIHKVKINEKYADRVLDGSKRFEIRFNDRDYQTGDVLEFSVINGELKPVEHRLDNWQFIITYVFALDSMGFTPSNYVVLSIAPYKELVERA